MPMLPGDSTFDSVTESAVERKIDELIDAGWDVLYSDFDVRAFDQWKKSAFSCLSALLGPDHKYTPVVSQLCGDRGGNESVGRGWHTHCGKRRNG